MEVELRRHTTQTPWTYAQLDARQNEIAERMMTGKGEQGKLLLSELSPVITLGRRASERELLHPDLRGKLGIETYRTNRGGLATYHGPGQWVVFPVDSLERLTGDRKGVKSMVHLLLQAALSVAKVYEPQAQIRCGAELGVWSPQGKVASVGISIYRRILLHGLAINGFKTPASFVGLRPCGLEAPVGYLLNGPNDDEFRNMGSLLIYEISSRLRKAGSANDSLQKTV
jgi:lipoyl(octanoyl) transferase